MILWYLQNYHHFQLRKNNNELEIEEKQNFLYFLFYIQIWKLVCYNLYIVIRMTERRGGAMKSSKAIEQALKKKVNKSIECRQWRKSIILEGEVNSWNEVVKAGYYAANKGYKGVVNYISVKGLKIPEISKPNENSKELHGKKIDVLIIGAGIIGSSIARELSKWNLDILLVDKEYDVAVHTSSRNDGMIHPGIVPHVGSNKSKFNIRGNYLYGRVSKELGVKINRCGSTILFDKNYTKLAKYYFKNKAKKVGLKEIEFLNKEELLKKEPNLNGDILWGVHFPSAAVTSPYRMTVAYAENAITNGVQLSLNTIVDNMKIEKDTIVEVRTNKGTIMPKVVINAAGTFSDKIANMANDQFFTIHPRKGEIVLLDKKKGELFKSIAGKPNIGFKDRKSKGGGVVKTIEGNLLIGPNAFDVPFSEDYSTNSETLNNLLNDKLPLVNGISKSDVITYFAGTRAATYEEDFIIEKSEYVDNLIHAAGIQSPGLASAPAIAEEVEKITIGILKGKIDLRKKAYWKPYRKPIPDLVNMSLNERSELIKQIPDYGKIVCRCEEISKGEIIDALNSPIKIDCVDSIKRRVRAGMGRCQGGFCTPSVMEIISEHENKKMVEIGKKGFGSEIVLKETRVEEGD